MAVRLVEVKAVDRITPQMNRITFGGEALAGFESRGAEDHLRVMFPQGDYDTAPILPVWGPDGPTLPEGVARPQSRDYTPLRFDETSVTFTEAFGLKALVRRVDDGFEFAVERSFGDMVADYLTRACA